MRVLIISTYDTGGGAAIAATRLMHALQSAGHDVSMAVRNRLGSDPSVFQVGSQMGNRFRFYGGAGDYLPPQPPIKALPVRRLHRQQRGVGHRSTGIPVGRRDPPALDKPGDAVTGRDRSNRGIRQKGGLDHARYVALYRYLSPRGRLHPLRDFMRQLPLLGCRFTKRPFAQVVPEETAGLRERKNLLRGVQPVA